MTDQNEHDDPIELGEDGAKRPRGVFYQIYLPLARYSAVFMP